jgi:hypothetical protein
MGEKLDADVFSVEQISDEVFSGRRLIGLASGIYWGRQDKSIFEAARKIPQDCQVFIVSTSGFRLRLFEKVYSYLLKRTLHRLDLTLIGQFHCPGHDKSKDLLFRWLNLSEGRPNEADFADAEKFVLQLKQR